MRHIKVAPGIEVSEMLDEDRANDPNPERHEHNIRLRVGGKRSRPRFLSDEEAIALADTLRSLVGARVLCCEGCGRPYRDMGLDIVLPNDQWNLLIGRDGDGTEGAGGILCGSCIAVRASTLTRGTVIRATIDCFAEGGSDE